MSQRNPQHMRGGAVQVFKETRGGTVPGLVVIEGENHLAACEDGEPVVVPCMGTRQGEHGGLAGDFTARIEQGDGVRLAFAEVESGW